MKTALLTAVGSASAGMVIERLHALGLRVVGCDIYPRAWNVASGEVDVFFQAVYATDADAYVRQMEEAVRREHADFLIPLTDVEVDALCAHKARFSALGCVLCVPDEPCARLCRDKQAMAALLAREGACRVIPTRSPYGWEPEAADYPLMLKPLHGRSSQGQVPARRRRITRRWTLVGITSPSPIWTATSTPWTWPASVSATCRCWRGMSCCAPPTGWAPPCASCPDTRWRPSVRR